MNFAIGIPDNKVRQYLGGEHLDIYDPILLHALHENEVIIPAPDPIPSGPQMISNGELKPYTYTVEETQNQMWFDTQVFRTHEASKLGIPTTQGTFLASDVDEIAQAATTAAMAKMMNRPYSTTWMLVDGTVRTFDADSMINVHLEVDAFKDSLNVYAQNLRTQIYAATTQDELSKIDITAGWPS